MHSGIKDITAQSGPSGSITATRVYDAYGATLSGTGQWSGKFGYGGKFGYQEDGNELQLLGHRYYDPTTGTFITRDPIKDGRNWYSYCDNNPISRVDANGLNWHNPGQAWVDPRFKGEVWVMREPGPGTALEMQKSSSEVMEKVDSRY